MPPPLSRADILLRRACGSSAATIIAARIKLEKHPHGNRIVLAGRDAYLDGARGLLREVDHFGILPPLAIPSRTEAPPYYLKKHITLRSTTGAEFDITELTPRDQGTNGKCVVLMAGIGMSTEGFFRIGEADPGTRDSILKRMIEKGFRVIIVDFPGIGKNKNYPSEKNDVDTIVDEIMPAFVQYLRTHPELSERGLYFLSHSLGGIVLNLYMTRNKEQILQDPAFAGLFKNKMTIATPETPLPDMHPFYPFILSFIPTVAPYLPRIPYNALRGILGNILPYGITIGGPSHISMVSANPAFSPALVKEMFDYSVQTFSLSLAMMMTESFRDGSFPGLTNTPPVWVPNQRNVRLVGHDDPLAPVEGLYARLVHDPAMHDRVALVGLRSEELVDQVIPWIGRCPIVGIVADGMRHLDIACVNPDFDQRVWPIILTFLEEPIR
ncbi:MAG: alpha/beta fold hydrolase [Candidatus Margulisbacteria bacterium]|nr:alpha/beta fold hydrolase [Candidatus Margulisiibacteriota bacterium]